MRKLAIIFGVLLSSSAFAQSSGIPWTNGRVLTAPMMQQFDAAKLNLQSLGKPGFAARLNDKGEIDAPIASSFGSFGGDEPGTAPNISLYRGAPDLLSGGPDSVFFGGLRTYAAPGQPNSVMGKPVAINMLSSPDGPYNSGCSLCIATTTDNWTQAGGRAAISGGDWRNGGASITQGIGNFDVVSQYDYAGSYPPKLTLPVASFDASGLTLTTQLTAAQIALLRVGQYVLTNVKNPSAVNQWPSGELPSNLMYGGFLLGWENTTVNGATVTHLDINGWAVPGGIDANGAALNAAGQIPAAGTNNANLDTYLSHYTSPMVFIGAPQKMFLSNWFMHYEEPDDLSNYPTMMHEFDFGEWDFTYKVNTPHSLDFSGLVINPQQQGGTQSGTDPFTARSQDLWLGGAVPTLLKLNPNAKTVEIECDRGLSDTGSCIGNLFVNKWTANDALSPDGKFVVGRSFVSAEYNNLVGGQRVGLLTRIVQSAATANAAGVDIRQTAMVDGDYANDNGTLNGTTRYHLADGSIALCPHDDDTKCTLFREDGAIIAPNDLQTGNGHSLIVQPATPDTVNGSIAIHADDGKTLRLTNSGGTSVNMTVAGILSAQSGTQVAPATYAALTSYNPSPGTQRVCSDCYPSTDTAPDEGMLVWWTGTKWADALGHAVKH